VMAHTNAIYFPPSTGGILVQAALRRAGLLLSD
jgi:hypothetical protein